jgi:hypothetical protein
LYLLVAKAVELLVLLLLLGHCSQIKRLIGPLNSLQQSSIKYTEC